jgi:predicted transcriptional regulator
MLTRKVKEIMLSLNDYAVVDCNASLFEALEVLDRAQAALEPGRHPHRAVLVKDDNGTIVGKMGHMAFLRALLPEHRAWEFDDAMLERAGVSPDMRDTSSRILELMGEDVVDVDERAKNVRVVDACVPTSATIEREAPLFEAIRTFLVHDTLSLLVTDGGRTVGILRLFDLLDELAREIRQG